MSNYENYCHSRGHDQPCLILVGGHCHCAKYAFFTNKTYHSSVPKDLSFVSLLTLHSHTCILSPRKDRAWNIERCRRYVSQRAKISCHQSRWCNIFIFFRLFTPNLVLILDSISLVDILNHHMNYLDQIVLLKYANHQAISCCHGAF